MGRLFSAMLLVALVGVGARSSEARDFADFGYVTGHYDGSTLQLEIHLVADGYYGLAAGFEVYRTALGVGACDTVRVTDQPIPFPGGPFPVTLPFADAGVAPGAAYSYEARPVDSQGMPIQAGFTVWPLWGTVTTGVALFAHATLMFDLYGSPNGYWTGFSCPQECLSGGPVGTPPAELMQYVDTSTPLLLYGEVVGVTLAYNFWMTIFRIDHGRASDCIIEVTPATWSTAKRLYR